MTIEQLQRLHQARPFRPFKVHLADGRAIPVTHPEFLSHSPTGRTMIVHTKGEAFEVIDLLLVSSLEVPDGEPPRRSKK